LKLLKAIMTKLHMLRDPNAVYILEKPAENRKQNNWQLCTILAISLIMYTRRQMLLHIPNQSIS